MVRVLHMSPAEMGYQALLSSMTALAASRLWGRALDQVGDRAVLIASGMLVALHVWVWVPSHPGFVWPVWVASVLGGIGWAGFNMAVFSWPQRLCGQSERQYAYGLLGFFSGPSFVLGSMTGGLITTFLPQVLFEIGTFQFLHYHLTFVLSSLGRLAAIILVAHWSLTFDRSTRSIAECIRDTARAIAEEFPGEALRQWLGRWGRILGISQSLGPETVGRNTGQRNRPEQEYPQAQEMSRFPGQRRWVGRIVFFRADRQTELESNNEKERPAFRQQIAS
jgi:MFS family permease